MSEKVLAKNKKALFDHTVLEKYTAGIILKGYEVKAIREGKATLVGSYVQILEGEPCVVNMHIGQYSKQGRGYNELESKRNRKLLLNAKETQEIVRELSQKGKTAIPLALVLKNNLIKLEFAVMKGKKEHEKKAVAKERQIEKDLAIFQSFK